MEIPIPCFLKVPTVLDVRSRRVLDYPHYTRLAEFRGVVMPEVLSGGNHDQIRKWRREKAIEKTWRNRPDLLEGAELSEEDRKLLSSLSKTANGGA